jgi:methyltransferase (TIGR00027 family)
MQPWMCGLFDNQWYQRFFTGVVDRLWPGELMRLVLRKRFFDDEVRAAIADGASQVLVVGAGFDTLGLRMAETFQNIRVVEVDAPSTAEKRRAAIGRLGVALSNHTVVAADLSIARMDVVFRDVCGWDGGARTVVVAEGVLMYLAEDDVRSFLAQVRHNCGSESTVVFSYLTADSQGRPDMGRWSGWSRLSLKLMGEPLQWSVREGELEPFIAGAGFRLLGPPERCDLRERYLKPAGIAAPVGMLERFAVAQRS